MEDKSRAKKSKKPKKAPQGDQQNSSKLYEQEIRDMYNKPGVRSGKTTA